MESKQLLENFLNKKYSHTEMHLSEEDKVFLSRYAVDRRQSNSVAMLKELDIGESFDRYFRENIYARIVRDDIQIIYKRFTAKLTVKNENPFDGKFPVFLDWWISKMDADGNCHCCYCEVSESTVQAAFREGLIHSKKPSFNGNLQIERKNPLGGYNRDNCEFACVICNNAKSDMISYDDFKKYFAGGVKQYWGHIEEQFHRK